MIDKNNDQELRNLIMEHYTKPVNFGFDKNNDSFIDLHSSTCSDDLKLQITMKDNKVNTAKFEGVACVISTSSADLLLSMIVGKTKQEVLDIIANYELLLAHDSKVNEAKLEQLIAFKNVYKQKGRINCATLMSNGLKEYLTTIK